MALDKALEEQIAVGMYDRGLLGFPEGGRKLKSGRNSPYYYNDRPSLSVNRSLDRTGRMSRQEQIEFRRVLAKGFGAKFLELSVKVDHIFGKAQAGTAPVALGAYEADISYLWERVPEPDKNYEAHQQIEGDYEEGEKVGMGDDVVTDAKSKKQAASLLRSVGLEPASVTIKFDRQEGGMEALATEGFEANALTNISFATSALFANGRIGSAEIDALYRYHDSLRADSITTTFNPQF